MGRELTYPHTTSRYFYGLEWTRGDETSSHLASSTWILTSPHQKIDVADFPGI